LQKDLVKLVGKENGTSGHEAIHFSLTKAAQPDIQVILGCRIFRQHRRTMQVDALGDPVLMVELAHHDWGSMKFEQFEAFLQKKSLILAFLDV
jgi:hypothetical protein